MTDERLRIIQYLLDLSHGHTLEYHALSDNDVRRLVAASKALALSEAAGFILNRIDEHEHA
jgi:hypothetical protein